MTLDTEQDRQLLLAIINQAQFKGEIVEHVSGLKRRVVEASLENPDRPKKPLKN
jgi:hypothetical protein